MQEAWEEAGVLGKVDQVAIGSYHYDKLQDQGFAVPVDVHVFAVDVQSLADEFPEAAERKRKWYDPARAAELVAEAGLKKLLNTLPSASDQKT